MRRALAVIILMVGQLEGQREPLIFGSSYVLPSPVTVAPGQLVTIIMRRVDAGQKPILRPPPGMDLPTSLAGLTVRYWQIVRGLPAPILEIHQFCANDAPWDWLSLCLPLSAVTIQIPFEARSLLRGEQGTTPGVVTVEMLDDDSLRTSLAVMPVLDQIHVLTVCDAILNVDTRAPFNPTGEPCASIVTHADGSRVSATNPASEGEHLVIYAVGLGQTNPPSVTGKLVTEAAPTQTKYTLDFNFRPNALASRPLPTGPQPVYAGTTPGYVGLYQINFVVPPVPAGTPACVDSSDLPLGSNVVESNLTVSIGGTYSFDGARICVAVPDL